MKRFLFPLLLLWSGIAVAAAAAEPLRPPPTPEESDTINGVLSSMASVTTRFADANADLCAKGNIICHVTLTIRDVNSISVQPTREGMTLTVPLLKYMKNEDEFGLVLAHEQAHRLLRHLDAVKTPAAETMADCLGTLLAVRAGFDPVKGADAIRRFAAGTSREEKAFTTSGEFGTKLDAGTRRQAIQRTAAMAKAGTSQEDMEKVCGVRLLP